MDRQAIAEPGKYYRESLKKEFSTAVKDFFQELVARSGINPEENRKLVEQYKEASEATKSATKTLNKYKTLRILSIVGAALLFLIGIMSLISGIKSGIAVSIIVGVLCLLGGSGLLYVIIKILNPKVKDADALKKKLEQEEKEALDKCYESMAPLNSLYDSDMTQKIIKSCLPIFEFDDYFSSRKLDMLNNKYGIYGSDDYDSSTIDMVTGDVGGNPFVIRLNKIHWMGTCIYRGQLTIHWTDRDSKGNVHSHSETLHAEIQKPKPYYGTDCTLTYLNEVIHDLQFTRKPNHAERMSEKEINRVVKAAEKELPKISDRSFKEGRNFIPLVNTKFEALFKAYDRTDEQQFRVLFSPLAQSNMIDLLTTPDLYGDDFSYNKYNCANFISAEHTKDWDMDTSGSRFSHYDIDQAFQIFQTFNNDYFQHFFALFAPVLASPAHQEYKSTEYIFRDRYPVNYAPFASETIANAIGQYKFAHEDTKTEVILKTRSAFSEGKTDKVNVLALSYRTYDRIEYVSVYGGDGRYHNVPVPWVEYEPISKESCMDLRDTGKTEREFYASVSGSNIASSVGVDSAYKNRLYGCISPNNSATYETMLSRIFDD